jgi:uncharacterized protein (TIGR02001 family)
VTAPAAACASRGLGRLASSYRSGAVGAAAVAAFCACVPAPASAETGATVSIFSDARFRGFSVSDDRPVALLDLSYDDPNGAYLAASGTAVASSQGVHPLALKLNGGYARRLPSGITVDAGIVHSRYSHYSSAVSGRAYTEIYGGVAWKSLSARLYVSPHYFETDSSTVYGEVEDGLDLAWKLRLSGHIGLLVPLRSERRPVYDWRIAVSRQFGRVSAHASWAGRGSVRRYEDVYTRPTNAVVLGVSCAL